LLKIILTNSQKSSQDRPQPAETKCSGNGHGQIFFLWESKCFTPWRLGRFGDFRKKTQQFSVALPTP